MLAVSQKGSQYQIVGHAFAARDGVCVWGTAERELRAPRNYTGNGLPFSGFRALSEGGPRQQQRTRK